MAIYKYTSLPSMEAMGINPNSNSKITAIKDQTGKVTGYEVNTNNNKEVEEFDVFNISSNLKTSMNDVYYSKKTNNVFKFQLDGIKITNLQDKNGINITKYVKGCSVLKIDDSKVYLDNGNIIYYDQDGFKYITGDIYKYNDWDHTKSKLITNVIAYVNKDTNKVIGYDDCKNMYSFSGTVSEKIVNDMLNDENFLKFYKEEYPDDEDLSKLLSLKSGLGVASTNGDFNISRYFNIIGIFRCYDGKEEEFEKIFGFPMYVINSDGLKVYNIYKLANLHYMVPSLSKFSDLLCNNYNTLVDGRIYKTNFTDENKEVFIKKNKRGSKSK